MIRSFNTILALCFILIIGVKVQAQGSVAPDSRAWSDPALNHNKLLKDQLGEGNFVEIGNFKVTGIPYLYGGKNNGNVFSPDSKAYNISISYNTFNQEIEFTSSANQKKPLVKEPGTVDSFTLIKNPEVGLENDVSFVSSALLGANDKSYYQ